MRRWLMDAATRLAVGTDRLLFAAIGRSVLARYRIHKDLRNRDDAAIVLISKGKEVAGMLSDEDLEQFEARELERLRSLENKGRANLMGMTLAFALLSIGLTLIGNGGTQAAGGQQSGATALLGIAIASIYFLIGGAHALGALKIGVRYGIVPSELQNNDEVRRRAIRLFYLEQNQLTTLLRSNALSVSFAAIRNGVFTLAFVVFWMTFSAWPA